MAKRFDYRRTLATVDGGYAALEAVVAIAVLWVVLGTVVPILSAVTRNAALATQQEMHAANVLSAEFAIRRLTERVRYPLWTHSVPTPFGVSSVPHITFHYFDGDPAKLLTFVLKRDLLEVEVGSDDLTYSLPERSSLSPVIRSGSVVGIEVAMPPPYGSIRAEIGSAGSS